VWPGRLERRSGRVVGKDPIELGAGADAELEEDLAQVVLDRARADEELGADLGVCESVVRWLVVDRENDLVILDAFSVSRGR
jgi:hypothetical protein